MVDVSYYRHIGKQLEFKMNAQKLRELKKQTNKPPKQLFEKVAISQNEFDKILMNPEITVIEKHFHRHNETQQVLFVIDDEKREIDYVVVKTITASGTSIFKEV